MPSTLYSTSCSIQENCYRLRVQSDQINVRPFERVVPHFDLEQTKIDELTSSDIPVELVDPTSTKIVFEPIFLNKRSPSARGNSVPLEIPLHYLLRVQRLETPSTKKKKKPSRNGENCSINTFTGTNSSTTSTSADENRPETPTSASSNIVDNAEGPQSSETKFRRFLSMPATFSADSQKTLIRLDFVDVSNLIQWKHRSLDIIIDSEVMATILFEKLQLYLSKLKQRPRSLLVFVNPLSGKGQARLVFERRVLPIFELANVSVKQICTESAGHAQKFIREQSLDEYDGLICVGGDGMFSELCHGLLLKTLSEENKNIDDLTIHLSRPNIRIGIIPAGSTDAVVFGTTGLNDPITSALQIIVGESLSIDITTVHNEQGFVRFMATMLSYGFFGDIIRQSDRWRCLGPLRYDLAGFFQFLRNKSYPTELIITSLADDTSRNAETQTISSILTNDSGSISSRELANPSVTDSVLESEISERTALLGTPFCSRDCEKCAGDNGHDFNRLHSSTKIKREGRYTTINCLNMPCRCAKSKYGMSPFVHLGDGTFDLILVKRAWPIGFLRFLWQVAKDGRAIEDLSNVERLRVSEVLIRPVPTRGKQFGSWACDGELINGNEIQIRVHRQALLLFAAGIQFKNVQNETLKTKSNGLFSCFRRKGKRDNVVNQ